VGELKKDEFDDLLLNQPLLVLFDSKPLGIAILVIVSALVCSILHLVVDLFEFIDSSHTLLKEGASEVLLSDLEFLEVSNFIGIIGINDNHVVFEDLDDAMEDIFVKLLDLVL
jgi:hypothetical protein